MALSDSSQVLLSAISQVRFENGKTPPIIRQFFVDQLRYNDNTINTVRMLLPFSIDFLIVNSIRMLIISVL